MSTHHYYYRRKIQWFPLQLPLDSFFSIPSHSLFYYSVKQTILLIVWLCDLFFAGRFQLYIAMFGFHRMKTKRKKQTQLIFSLSIGICFYWANFLWMGKIQPNQLNWMNSWRHKKNHTQLQFTVFESQQLSVTCGSLEIYACIFIVIREPYWKRG